MIRLSGSNKKSARWTFLVTTTAALAGAWLPAGEPAKDTPATPQGRLTFVLDGANPISFPAGPVPQSPARFKPADPMTLTAASAALPVDPTTRAEIALFRVPITDYATSDNPPANPAAPPVKGAVIAAPRTAPTAPAKDAPQPTTTPRPTVVATPPSDPTPAPGAGEPAEIRVDGPVGKIEADSKSAAAKPSAKTASSASPAPSAAEPPKELPQQTVKEPKPVPKPPTQPQVSPAPAATAKAATVPAEKKAEKPVVQSEPKLLPKAVEKPAPKTESTEPAEKPVVQTPPKPVEPPQLSPAMVAVRDRLRWTLAAYTKQPFNLQENHCGDILAACTAYGCATEVQSGQEFLNGITCLCWNYSCAGYELLKVVDGHIAPRVGYGLQERPAQFLSVLALSRVPPEYPLRVGRDVRTVADLVTFEKLNCRTVGDQALRLVGLAHYVPIGETWRNNLGEECSIDQLVQQELDHPAADLPYGGTQRLLGLAFAVSQQMRSDGSNPESLQRAEKYLADFRGFAFRTQSAEGSWNPHYFARAGASDDTLGKLRATAHIMQWLAITQPEKELHAARMVDGIQYLTDVMINTQPRWNIAALNAQGMDAATTALSALMLYDLRALKPFDVKEPVKKDDKPAAADPAPAPQPGH